MVVGLILRPVKAAQWGRVHRVALLLQAPARIVQKVDIVLFPVVHVFLALPGSTVLWRVRRSARIVHEEHTIPLLVLPLLNPALLVRAANINLNMEPVRRLRVLSVV